MRYLMHVITVGCIDIYENVQESWLDIHLKILFKNIWYEYWHQFYRISSIQVKFLVDSFTILNNCTKMNCNVKSFKSALGAWKESPIT